MTAKAYIDINIEGKLQKDGLQPIMASLTMKLLHVSFSKMSPSHSFAIDLPKYGNHCCLQIIRVFAQNTDSLVNLVKAIEGPLRNYGILSSEKNLEIKQVPENYSGNWVICKRFRVSSRKSFSKSELKTRNARLSTMQYAENAKLPYVSMKSASNNNVFRLFVERNLVDPEFVVHQDPQDWQTCGYGLSTSFKKAPVPALP